MRVFLTGGTGLIGRRLIPCLTKRGDAVVLLTRRASAAQGMFSNDCAIVEGDPMRPGPWMDRIAECDAVINLAGESIFGRRWNAAFKALLKDSRVRSTENVVRGLELKPRTPSSGGKALINASAIGFYGPLGDELVTEDHAPGNDYLAEICVAWEKAARKAEEAGVRVVIVRIGVVLAREGGALAQMVTPFKLFAGGPVGSGRQWMSWIHIDDLAGIFLLALDNASASGPINGTAPNPVTNKDFAKALGRALHRPSFMPTPALALRLMLGEVAEVVTTGQRVLPQKAQALGYAFKFPTVEGALAEIFAG